MSYIPKYILKRMLPKDSIKVIENGGIQISMTNVISPIPIEEVPENVLDYVVIKVDGNEVAQENLAKIKIAFEDETYELATAQKAIGKTIPMGGKLSIIVPDLGMTAGDSHEVEVTIKTDNPINIKVKRTFQ